MSPGLRSVSDEYPGIPVISRQHPGRGAGVVVTLTPAACLMPEAARPGGGWLENSVTSPK